MNVSKKEKELYLLKSLISDLQKTTEKPVTYYQESNMYTLKFGVTSVHTCKGLYKFNDFLLSLKTAFEAVKNVGIKK